MDGASVRSGVLSAALALPGFRPLTPPNPAYAYPPPLPSGLADTAHMIPRQGYRFLRGFFVADHAFVFILAEYTDTGAALTAQAHPSQINANTGLHEVLLQDLPILGRDFMVILGLVGAGGMTVFDYHLELVP